MVKKNKQPPIGVPVYIKTVEGVFDCIGIIHTIHEQLGRKPNTVRPRLGVIVRPDSYYDVEVLKYIGYIQFEKKRQRYYFDEVSKIISDGISLDTVELLYTGD